MKAYLRQLALTMRTILMVLVSYACTDTRNSIQQHSADSIDAKNSNEYSGDAVDNAEGAYRHTHNFDSISFITTKTLKPFQKKFLDTLVKNGDAEFETDTAYVIEFVKNYIVNSIDTIFYIRGQFVPSTVEFHCYGGHNGNEIFCDIYHLPIETSFRYTYYETSNDFISVYGEMSNIDSDDNDQVFLFQLNHY